MFNTRFNLLLTAFFWTAAFASAQTVSGVLLDPPVVPNPGPPKPGQLPGTISAPHLTTSEKFEYRVVQSFGLRNFVGAAISASIGQAIDSPHEWGQGVGGFAERYASGFAGTFSRQAFAFTLETPLHEDPRYFPLSKGAGFKTRTLNALKQVVWTKNDDGGSGIAYARLGSAFGAAEYQCLAAREHGRTRQRHEARVHWPWGGLCV